jgi:hypothetical protein
VGRFNVKKSNEADGKDSYGVEISNGFSAMKNADSNVSINREREDVIENIQISAEG